MSSLEPNSAGLQFREFRALAGLARFGVALLDARFRLRCASTGAWELLDCADEDALKRHWHELLPHLQLATSGEESDAPLQRKVDIPAPGGARLLRIEVHSLKHASRPGYLLLLKNRAELGAEEPLLMASHAVSHGYLATALLHDANAPLNNLKLTLSLFETSLERRLPATFDQETVERWQRYLGVLQKETNRLAALMQELRAMSQVLPSSYGLFDMRDLLNEVGRLMRHEATTRQIGFETIVPAQAVTLGGDRGRIRLALLNLVIHLLETTAGDGRISLVLEESRPNDGCVRLRVSSNSGVFAPEIAREFYRLEFASKAGQIGLYAARLIIEAHGGDVELLDAPQGPFGFAISLPVARQ
jgi:signal transduction histidine kinase